MFDVSALLPQWWIRCLLQWANLTSNRWSIEWTPLQYSGKEDKGEDEEQEEEDGEEVSIYYSFAISLFITKIAHFHSFHKITLH